MQERVQKVLSQWGIASRRQAEQMILEGRVRLNGEVAHLGQRTNPALDEVAVDGRIVKPIARPQLLYLLLNKPVGIVSTCDDPQNRLTVLDLLPQKISQGQGLHPVGRLDVESTGALLLTNDGDLTYYLTHPRHHVPKTYQAWVEGVASEQMLRQWRQGVLLEGRKTLPAQVKVIQRARAKTLLEVILNEGRNRQIRRVANQLGYPVLQLHRTAIDSIQINPPDQPALPSGAYRPLESFEVQCLKDRIDLTPIRSSAEIQEHSR
ncbi:MAG: rRNA pseudouridine synthase [Phormidesmis sp. CAN_BIN36]|nr:rRNA pseudouridine synthase [Phormidesmis sp. CAN_BIN36]